MALKMNFREVTPEDTEILRMIALRNGKAEDYLCCDVTNEDGVTQTTWYSMQALLKRAQKPTAVISASDAVAFGAMRAAHEAGIDIPGDLSLVGFDDGMLAAYSYPPLTSIRRPIGEMAAEGARQLLRLIEGESWPENTVCYPVRLSIKKSIRRLNATERK